MKVGVLELEMFANVARIQSDINQMNNIVSSGARKMSDAAATVTRALGAIGVGLSAGAFVQFVKGAIDATAKLDDLAEMTGATVEALSALRQVARVSGQDFDSVTGAMTKLAKGLAGVDDESKGVGGALKALGLGLDDVKKLRADEQMQAIAKAMTQFEDGTGKAAVAQVLFGKSGAQLLPYLKDLAEWGTLNASVTAEQAAEAEKLQKSLKRLESDAQDVGTAISIQMIPYMQAVMDEIKGVAGSADSFAPLKVVLETVIVLGSELAFMFKTAGMEIGAWAAQIAALGQGDFAAFSAISKMVTEDAERVRKEHDAFIDKIMKMGDAVKQDAATTQAATKRKLEYSSSADTAAKAYESLQKKAAEYIKTLEKETAQAGLNAIQKRMVEASIIAITLKTEAERQSVMNAAAALAIKTQAETEAKEAAEEWLKFQQDAERANAQRLITLEASVQTAEDEIAHFGWSKSAIEADTIARLENNRVIVLAHGATQESLKYLDEEIALRKRLAGAMNQREALDKSVENWKSIEQAAHETWTAVSRDGTDAFKQIGKTLKAAILDALYQMTVKRWIIDISASVSGRGVSGQAFPGSGGAGGAMNFLGMGNAVSGAANWLNLGGMSAGFASGVSETMLGSSFVGPSASLAGGSTGFAASVGQAAPYVAAAIIAAEVIQSVWGHKPHDPEGSAYMAGGEMTDAERQSGNFKNAFGAWNPFSYNRAFTADMQSAQTSFLTSINSYDESIARVISSTQKAAIENKLLADTADRVNFSDFAKGMTQVGEERKALILDALGGLYKELGQAIPYDQLGAFISQIDNLKNSLKSISPALAESPEGVIRAFGGAGNFNSALGQYIDAIFSPEEKQGLLKSQMAAQFEALKLAMPDTLAGFRALVQGLDVTSDAGATTYARLLQLAPAFAQVTEAVVQSNQDLMELARQIRGEGLTSPQRLSSVQADFTIATAAARAGDQSALAKLPELSRALLELTDRTSVTGIDARRSRALTANSLEETARLLGLRSYAVGTDYVPRDMLAMIHEGEAIVPRQYNPAAGGSSNNQRLEALVERLSNEVVMLRAEVRAVVSNTSDTSKTLRLVTAEGGNALNTVVVV